MANVIARLLHSLDIQDAIAIEGRNWHYRSISEIRSSPELGEYRTYGISVKSRDYTATLHDITACRHEVARLARLFNRLQLSPVHLMDAVEDFICEL